MELARCDEIPLKEELDLGREYDFLKHFKEKLEKENKLLITLLYQCCDNNNLTGSILKRVVNSVLLFLSFFNEQYKINKDKFPIISTSTLEYYINDVRKINELAMSENSRHKEYAINVLKENTSNFYKNKQVIQEIVKGNHSLDEKNLEILFNNLHHIFF